MELRGLSILLQGTIVFFILINICVYTISTFRKSKNTLKEMIYANTTFVVLIVLGIAFVSRKIRF